MSINLDKYKYDLVEGWREVMDSKNPIDWAIFGYDGQSFDLKLACKGTGGIDEMVDNFNSGRIMYGLCRVKIKDRNIEKIALINWQGEGAPLARKGTCANHLTTVKHFFKGIHVTINARTDEDVDPENIRGNISKTTSASAEGVCMSSSVELETKPEPVGSPYTKLNPQVEINTQAKDEFWRKDEVEEENRKKAEKNRVAKFSQNEVKLLRKESQDYFEQEQLEKSVGSLGSGWSPVTSPSPTASLPASTNGDFNGTTPSSTTTASVGDPSPPTSPTFTNTFVTTEKDAVLKASIPRKNTGANLVRQRIKSFDANPNERVLNFNAVTTNGSMRASSKSPATDADGEHLSVLKRKAMFESGIVSNTSQPIIKKDPAQEIKSLQEESQNKAKAAAAENKKKALESSNVMAKSHTTAPDPEVPVGAKKPPVSTPTSAAQAAAAMKPAHSHHAHPPANVKAYNLPFHIGGGVSSRLAEKVNRNTFDEAASASSKEKVNLNGTGTSNLSSIESIPALPSSITLTTNATMAEFQADPIPQHITTNFEPNDSSANDVAPTPDAKVSVPAQPISTVAAPEPEHNAKVSVAEQPVSAVMATASEEAEIPTNPSPLPANEEKIRAKYEDTTVQSGEAKKSPSPLPTPIAKEGSTTPVPVGMSFVIKPEMGLCARALYDYQAADESEITFDPGEIITNIETIDEGWWEGMGPHGVYGLFPSNYVELMN